MSLLLSAAIAAARSGREYRLGAVNDQVISMCAEIEERSNKESGREQVRGEPLRFEQLHRFFVQRDKSFCTEPVASSHSAATVSATRSALRKLICAALLCRGSSSTTARTSRLVSAVIFTACPPSRRPRFRLFPQSTRLGLPPFSETRMHLKSCRSLAWLSPRSCLRAAFQPLLFRRAGRLDAAAGPCAASPGPWQSPSVCSRIFSFSTRTNVRQNYLTFKLFGRPRSVHFPSAVKTNVASDTNLCAVLGFCVGPGLM